MTKNQSLEIKDSFVLDVIMIVVIIPTTRINCTIVPNSGITIVQMI